MFSKTSWRHSNTQSLYATRPPGEGFSFFAMISWLSWWLWFCGIEKS